MQIAVIGGGSWGTTIASQLSCKAATTLWCRNSEIADSINARHENPGYLPGLPLSEALRATTDIREAVASAETIAIAVPSHAMRSVMQEFAPRISPDATLVSLTKGLEQQTHLRMSEVLAETLPGSSLAVLSGPSLAKEVMVGHSTSVVIASRDLAVAAYLQSFFANQTLQVSVTDDMIGVELGGGLKNVVALAVGIAVGQGGGRNTQAALATRGFAEITSLGVAMGAKAETFAGVAGIGDLVATCFSQQSRNLHVGTEIGSGRALKEVADETTQVAEGIRTAESAAELGQEHGIPMPIAEEVRAVLRKRRSPKEAYRRLCQA